jgi:hypothetical protein
VATVKGTRLIFEAVLELLEYGLAVPVGDTEAPGTLPHTIVYPVRGGNIDGTLGEPDVDIEMPIQIDCVSLRRWQAQWLQDEVRHLMLAQTLDIEGRGLIRVYCDDPSGVEVDNVLGEREGQVFYTSDVFHIKTSPE